MSGTNFRGINHATCQIGILRVGLAMLSFSLLSPVVLLCILIPLNITLNLPDHYLDDILRGNFGMGFTVRLQWIPAHVNFFEYLRPQNHPQPFRLLPKLSFSRSTMQLHLSSWPEIDKYLETSKAILIPIGSTSAWAERVARDRCAVPGDHRQARGRRERHPDRADLQCRTGAASHGVHRNDRAVALRDDRGDTGRITRLSFSSPSR